MEKEIFFVNDTGPNWQSSLNTDIQLGELNSSSEQLQAFYNPSWDNSMDQTTQFESAMSSMVSSPVTSTAAAPADSVVIRELIGRLGSIYNSGEVSPPSYSYVRGTSNNSTNTSCYSTPLNSPPKLNLSLMEHQIRGNLPMAANAHHSLAPLPSGPGFAERAARNACFGSQNFGGVDVPSRSMPKIENGKLSRVSSSQSLKAGVQMESQDGMEVEKNLKVASGSSGPDEAEGGDAREESSISDQILSPNEMNARKRKAISKSKQKDKDPKLPQDDDSDAKLSKISETNGTEKGGPMPKVEQKQNKDNSKPPESPKDYIHVRARRGQATDSHSLAERVRREKISERMKFLQDLVPGCNKVTGKAVMLDEIINYVQSLQRQVEFLSMKLATVNPKLDFSMEALLSKDVVQLHGSLPQTVYPFNPSAPAYPFGHQLQPGLLQNVVPNDTDRGSSVSPLEASLHRSHGMQLPTTDRFNDASCQFAGIWDNDLQTVVQMGFGQNQHPEFAFQSSHGTSDRIYLHCSVLDRDIIRANSDAAASLPTAHMKNEL